MGQLTRPEIVDGVRRILGLVTGKDQSRCSENETLESIGIGTHRDQTLLDLRLCLEKEYGTVLNYDKLPFPSKIRKTPVSWFINEIARQKPVLETI